MVGIVWCVVLVLAVTVVIAGARQARASYEARCPPISDAEFVARCSPGTRPEVALKVRRIIATHLAVEYDRIHPSTRFIEDLGAD